MNGLFQDVRYALRQLRKSPGFTVVAVLMLALGIGANTAIFSMVNAVLLRPLPYEEADRLVMVWEQNPHRGWFENIVSAENFLDWKKQNHVFADMAAFESNFFNLSGGSKPEEIAGERVTSNLFSVLGVQPVRGRLFLPEEEKRGSAVAIVSYGLWQEHYGGDPALVGKPISLNGEAHTVVGILPASFTDDYSASFAPHSRVWIAGLNLQPEGREWHDYHAIARLKPDVTLVQAQTEMDTIASRIEQQYPESKGWGVALVGLHDQVVKYTRPALLVLLGAVALVLLIACANVANLMLVRATGREKETAIRAALGASRGQIIRQFLVESTLLSMIGAALGLVIAGWGSEILVRLSPPETPRLEGAAIDGYVLLFTVVVALGTGIVFGLAPALGASRPNVNESLKESGRSSSTSAKGRRLRDALVISEFGLALALLVGAGLMVKTLLHLHRVDIGLSPDNVLTLKVPLEGPQYEDQRRQAEFFQQLLARIEALPGVESASVSRGVPMYGWAGWNFVTADHPNPPAGEVPDANYVVIGPHYFRTMGIPLRLGRPFSDHDTPTTEPVVIVSESLARKHWPGQDPIGKRLKVSSDANDKGLPWLSVVGVAGNVRSEGQYAPFVPELYVPYTQGPWLLWPRHIMVRTASSPTAIVPTIRREVAALDEDVPVSDVSTMKEIVAGPVRQGQTVMWLLGSFATLALVLAAVGIYSVISYAVTQRTHELGIRMALGADRRTVVNLVVKQGLVLATVGVAIGLAGAWGMAHFVSRLPFEARLLLLFDVQPTDPLTFVAVPAILAMVALLASYFPGRRAAKVDPIVALRYE
ncbi:MAG: ABC transporter permease [Acidobacteriia bacterium]|nr:ABC transporter permease [Terriglobia bacterium]